MKASMRQNKMEVSNASDIDDDNDEYIEIKLYSPRQSRDFEFPMASVPWDREAIEFPADELFYKGKLLPLHLPPRLQMVQKLCSPEAKRYHCRWGVEAGDEEEEDEDDSDTYYSLPHVLIMPMTAPSTNTSTSTTLIASCNVSPSESHRVSFHFSPEEDKCFFECSNDLRYQDEKKPSFNAGKCPSAPSCAVLWPMSLKQIKLSLLCRKFKASKDYLRSLFMKAAGGGRGSICSGAAGVSSPSNVGRGSWPEWLRKSQKQTSLEQISDRGPGLRPSFKKRINRKSAAGKQDIKSDSDDKSTSSSSSSNSSPSSSSSACSSSYSFKLNGEFQPMMRSSRASSELERSIEGAIAHCKKSLP